MVQNWLKAGRIVSVLLSVILFAVGAYLYMHSRSVHPYTHSGFLYDLIWLDAWAILSLVVALAVVLAGYSRSITSWWMVLVLSLYGTITISLIFAGTDFSINGMLGDQQFRQAMLLKLQTFGLPGDFYYKGLPPFYPPLYYLVLSILARIGSFEAHQMLKIGSVLIYLCGPFFLFFFWSKIVSSTQAICITIATFLIASAGQLYPLLVPHAFVADVFFVPWWLYFVERVTHQRLRGWPFWVLGGIIGGALFSTYFFGFFIGGVALVLRALFIIPLRTGDNRPFQFGSAFKMLGAAAIASSPYWLPLFVSIARHGMDRSRGGWHHIGVTGITFDFLQVSVLGVLYLLSILWAVRHFKKPVYQGLIVLVGASIAFWLIGSITGANDISVNLVKTRQFVHLLAGPVIGLCVAGVVRFVWRYRRVWRPVVGVLLAVVALAFLNDINATSHAGNITKARTTRVPQWAEEINAVPALAGKVMLAGDMNLYSYVPVYAFNSVNEHYAHPAGEYKHRYDFLYLLQSITDPALIHLCLRYNRFDPVDYIKPLRREGQLHFFANISNYPDRMLLKTIRWTPTFLNDSTRFRKVADLDLYEVEDSVMSYSADGVVSPEAVILRDYLTEKGRELWDQYAHVDGRRFHDVTVASTDFNDSLRVYSACMQEVGDSLVIYCELEVCEDIDRDYRIFLHQYCDDKEEFENYDLQAPSATGTWKKWDRVVLVRTVCRPERDAVIHLGLFAGADRLGSGAFLKLSM